MTLSLHKLWAGSGYEYLTRQVARQDATHLGRSSLASYYTERGETPGVWVGAGLAGVDGLAVGDVVTAEQMRALFGAGQHPLAAERMTAARAGGASDRVAAEAARLGSPFRLRSTSAQGFDVEVDRQLATRRAEPGGRSEVSSEVRSGVVSEVAAEWFVRHHGRPPADARELAGAVARWTRRTPQPVAGFDLTFSPVKSVSALWAVAPLDVAAEIERAHQAAVADALRFIEEQALFTREGTDGVRQVEVTGLVGTAFTHRDSRAGDPDLHTHVAVANKVQTRQGRWLAVDGRVLYAATVAASETYNTALEGHLGERLGVRFEAGPAAGGRREVREVVGVDQRLLTGWSSRRRAIDVRRAELGRDFQDRTGRPATRKEAWGLAQQATLETRTAKHEPRTLTEQRTAWAHQAAKVLGGVEQIQALVTRTLTPAAAHPDRVDAAWVARVAGQVVRVMEGERATWGRFHLHAEAQRQVRPAGLEPGLAGQVVDLVVAEATNLSVLLRGPVGVGEPAGMRRSDGVSVYEPVGEQRWTSQRVLAAENLVMDLATRRDGRRVDPVSVQVALQEVAVEGVALNAGQVGLVRDLAGSGARVQLALAPAGTGKTTALRVLSKAWTTAGGTVVGLAPSASAAAVLGEQLGGPTDTLAKLVWSLDHPGVGTPAWVTGLGAGSLVVVDEAGLADTPSVARAVQHIVAVGGSVRLVGDDRQLGAVGAGGLLRDLDQRFGAARLDEVVRFTDPAEAAASLALRDGRKEALGFYLDQHRVHVGDSTTAPAQLLDGWAADRAAGRDALMLAPTRTAVADLNQAARSRRLDGQQPTREVALADGNHASTGDTIVTRTNDRRLRLTGHGWVRNGARWTVDTVHRGGALTVTPVGGGPTLRLPAEYVAASVELGYAATIHAAQGVTCDTVHGLVTGSESRPQLYTLLTRGRHANHLYLQTDGAADLHDLNRPDSGTAPTPTEVLERITDRDGTAQSASSLLADRYNPALRLPVEIGRYLDAVHLAADRTADPAVIDQLNRVADRLLPNLREAPAWPALRSHLLLCAADGADPARRLRAAAAVGPLDDARDPAAVLHHRASTLHQARTPDRPVKQGPLPWLPHLPHQLRADPTWGTYLQARSDLVSHLAEHVHRTAVAARPEWATHLHPHVGNQVVGQVAVWRAARQVQVTDPILTGPPAAEHAARHWQQHLNQITGSGPTPSPPLPLVTRLTGAADHDPFRDTLSLHLASLAGQGVDVAQHLRTAAQRPLPDDHPSAALWWRLHRQLPTATLITPHPATEPPELPDPNPRRLDAPAQPAGLFSPTSREARTDAAFLLAGLLRLTRHHTQPNSAPEGDGEHRDRLLGVNRLAHDYYRAQLTGSWSARYLTERCGGQDISDDVRFQPGHALHGWTSLVDHLRRHGVTDDDMINAGLASRTRQGRIVDRFRDRLILPLWNHHHDLVGFVARRHPDHDNTYGPKYLNTPTTTLFTKGHHLYGHHLLPPTTGLHGPNPNGSTDLVPVLVEGPLDAIAVTLAGHNHYVGLATLGTALTQTQAAALAAHPVDPILAPDNDPPGQTAANRNFWRLTPHGLDPQLAVLPPQQDPAGVLTDLGPDALRHLLTKATPQGDHLIRQQGVTAGEDQQCIDIQLRTTAARPPHTWAAAVNTLSLTHHLPVQELREQLLPLAHEATRHPTDTAQRGEHLTHRPVAGAGPFTGRRARPTQDSATATSPPQPDRTPPR